MEARGSSALLLARPWLSNRVVSGAGLGVPRGTCGELEMGASGETDCSTICDPFVHRKVELEHEHAFRVREAGSRARGGPDTSRAGRPRTEER